VDFRIFKYNSKKGFPDREGLASEGTPMAEIIDRGRGPEIAGTRITVYDILDYYLKNWHHTAIAATLRISSAQVKAAIAYIEQHKEEVMANYQEILDRCARGNPPELQAKLDAIDAKYQILWADKIRRTMERMNGNEGNPGGHYHPGPSPNFNGQ
jgi:uncharacterized protein (DUF433 family)